MHDWRKEAVNTLRDALTCASISGDKELKQAAAAGIAAMQADGLEVPSDLWIYQLIMSELYGIASSGAGDVKTQQAIGGEIEVGSI